MYSLFKKHTTCSLLILFFIVALTLRVYGLGSVPGGFHEDEAHIGYNAYSILRTLHDKNNVFLPLAIDQFGDFRPSGLHFLTVPSVAFFGLTEFATRIPVALFGAFGVIAFYLLTKEIFRKESIALITAGMMVINPWHIIASRSTSESIVALFFVTIGVYGLLVFLRKSKEKTQRTKSFLFLILAIVSFCLSFQFYHAARYFVPFIILFILAFTVFDKAVAKKLKIILFAGMFVVLGFLFFLFTFGSGSGRVQEVSIFTHPATAIEHYAQKKEDQNYSGLAVQFFHNKIIVYGYTALNNYGTHFTPSFLFLNGGLPPRYMVPWNGNYYPIDALFIIVGFSLLFTLIFEKKNESWLIGLPFFWLAAGPLPAAFTFEDMPHFQRAIMMMPALLFFAAYGLYKLFMFSKAKPYRLVFSVLIGFLLTYQVAIFLHDYFHHTLTHESKYRNEGQKELVLAVNEYKNEKRNLVMTSEGANHIIFYLFHNKVDPSLYQKMGSPRDAKDLVYDNALYKEEDCPSYSASDEIVTGKLNSVFVDLGECLPRTEVKLIKEILRPDGTVAFRISEIDIDKANEYMKNLRKQSE